jgi:PAB-dependent poly(A)-specific ribonuclease subunit 2
MEKLCSFKAHAEPLLDFVVLSNDQLGAASHSGSCLSSLRLVSLSANALRCHSGGGLVLSSHQGAEMRQLTSMLACSSSSLNKNNENRFLLGSALNAMLEFDLERGRTVKEVALTQGVACLEWTTRGGICVGGVHGEVQICDSRTHRIEHSLTAHSGGVVDMCAQSDLLVTCGWTKATRRRHMPAHLPAASYADPMLKVYDMRMMRPLAPVRCASGAGMHRVDFHPRFTSTVIASSQDGHFQLCDVQAAGAMPSAGDAHRLYRVDTGGDALLSFDLSSTCETLAFGDAGGYVHQWACAEGARLNYASLPIDMPPPSAPPSVSIVDGAAFAERNAAELDAQLPFAACAHSAVAPPSLADAPPRRRFSDYWVAPSTLFEYRLPSTASESLVRELGRSLNQIDFVGYAPNPGTRLRNQVIVSPYSDMAYPELFPLMPVAAAASSALSGASPPLHMLSSSPTANMLAASPNSSALMALHAAAAKASRRPRRPPKKWRFIKVRTDRRGIDQLQFSRYNKTAFGSLESTLPNAYWNSLLQALYFMPHVRVRLLSHLCARDDCVSCELGFVFHMLDLANGRNCHAGKLLAALRRNRRARQMGLVIDSGASSPPPQMADPADGFIERFASFLLAELDEEARARSSPADALYDGQPPPADGAADHVRTLFGAQRFEKRRCLTCGTSASQHDKSVLHTQLVYPTPYRSPPPSFAALLKRSLERDFDKQCWCEQCSSYEPTHVERSVHALPNVLCINAGVREHAEHMRFWMPPADAPVERGGNSWLPLRLRMQIDSSKRLNVQEASEQASGPDIYELVSIMSHVTDGEHIGHAIAHVKIGAEAARAVVVPPLGVTVGNAGGAPAIDEHGNPLASPMHAAGGKHRARAPGWYMFNDLGIMQASRYEVFRFDNEWRIPAILFYARVHLEVRVPLPAYVNPINERCWLMFDPFADVRPSAFPSSPNKLTFHRFEAPLDSQGSTLADQLPVPRELVAIDAEFVAAQQYRSSSSSSSPIASSSSSPSSSSSSSSPIEAVLSPAAANGEQAKLIIQPGQFKLARVSVIQERRADGKPILDDYIATTEAIDNYLTRFSGIREGDLDPSMSPHHVVPEKHCYVKLRNLIDRGAVLCGHGLKKDFRIINLVVPPEQVVDTVELFHLDRQRNVSLRFLVSYLLGNDIQSDTHCSTEDALSALLVYRAYQRLLASNRLADVTHHIYRVGRQLNWKLPGIDLEPAAGGDGVESQDSETPPLPDSLHELFLQEFPDIKL